jgi:hypothetical protein
MEGSNINFPKDFLDYIQTITNKRARILIEHVIKNGFITTEELEKTYGYNHPPRAARDVRELGIPLETFNIKSKEGKSIAAYKFGDLTSLKINRISGRIQFTKEFKRALFNLCNGHCQVCNGKYEERYLQIDHKVPYEIGGDLSDHVLNNYMLLCGSCNRSKSWSCEHCENWRNLKKPSFCMKCYWGKPEDYTHIALEQVRRLDIQWVGDEVKFFDRLKIIASESNLELREYIKIKLGELI